MASDLSQAPETSEPTDQPTPERLLDAAEALFAEGGYGNTSVRDITDRAGSNLASVNYHFGGKENLYQAVFHRALTLLREHRVRGLEAVLGQPDLDLEALLQTFARVFVEPLAGGRGQVLMQLFLRELLDPHLEPGIFYGELVEPITQVFSKALGRTCPELSEELGRLCLLSLVGQLIHVLNASTMYVGADMEKAPELDLQRALKHVVQFTAAGIRDYTTRDSKGVDHENS